MRANGASMVLGLLSVLMVAAAIFVVSDKSGVAVSLIVLGSGMVCLAAVLPRVEGTVTLGPQGLTVPIIRAGLSRRVLR
jgi:hypothetical protein